MSDQSKREAAATSGGIGFFGLLTILFIGLKLTDHIDWSWVWVLSPLWLPIAVFIAIVLGFFILAILFKVIEAAIRPRVR